MMKPESLVELTASSNFATVDEEWMRLVEAPNLSPAKLAEYSVVLAGLCGVKRTSQAEELAWAAIEAVRSKGSPREALAVAGPFLLAIGESDELRAQVVELYRTAFAEHDGLDGLLEESGLGGGRPVRRALRTLDVCLLLKEGDYLAARDEETAARVDKIDRSSWQFSLTTGDSDETLGAVRLADRFRPADQTEFWVMRQFSPDDLIKQMWSTPAPVLVDICKHAGNRIDSDTLERLLVPELLSESDWKKWWTKARTAVKRSPYFQIKGRSPYELTYSDSPVSLEGDMLTSFDRLHDPLKQLEIVENYVRDCKARSEEPNEEALARCHGHFAGRAAEMSKRRATQAGLWWMAARRVAQFGVGAADSDRAVEFFKGVTDAQAVFSEIRGDGLLELASECLIEARPDDWPEQLARLLPSLHAGACDKVTVRLIDAGHTADDFEPIIQEIISSPVAHFEALLWLWEGPSQAKCIPVPPLVSLLSRILRALGECRRSEVVPKEKARQLGGRARQVLSARKYERFRECLTDIEPGMAHALHTQVRQLDLLGVTVHEKLLGQLRAKFPTEDETKETPRWLREDVLYVTHRGMVRKQQEIDHHVNVTMRENAKAIGRAAAHGDLSENSEYKFALEERDLLRARLAQMNEEMAAAQVLDPADVPADHIDIGTEVKARRVTDNEPYELTIAGPWEADSSKAWYNYKTPLAQKLLGKRVGDTVEFEHTGANGTYEIVALGNAFDLDS